MYAITDLSAGQELGVERGEPQHVDCRIYQVSNNSCVANCLIAIAAHGRSLRSTEMCASKIIMSIEDSPQTGAIPSLPLQSHATTPSTTAATSTGITEDEAALYDRQLRLWGVEAQNRMRQSHVLLCGSFRGISTEVAKNIVLAGVGRVALCDSEKVEWKDLGSGYWEREEDIGQFVRSFSTFARSV